MINILLCFCIVFWQAIPAQAFSSSSRNPYSNSSKLSITSVNSFQSLSSYRLNYNKYKLIKGKSFRLKVSRLPSNYRVTYKSKNDRIATVNNKGIITGVKNGNVSIVATVSYKSLILRRLTCRVSVGPAAISVVIPESKLSIKLGEQKDLNPIVKPKFSAESPRFLSSNSKIVTVTSSGIIKGIRKGTAVITVSIGNKKFDKCVVTVNGKTKK